MVSTLLNPTKDAQTESRLPRPNESFQRPEGLPPFVPKADPTRRGVRLTKREIEVLSLIAQGMSSKEAADELFVSKRTIDFHLANIYDKLQVNNRVQAFLAATRLGLIPFEPTSTMRSTGSH